MISRTASCFVYATLPGEKVPVPAGRFELDARGATPVGRFRYGGRYLDRPNAVAIDPVTLPLQDTMFLTAAKDGLFRVLRDASPDSWGREVIQRALGTGSVLDEMDYLLLGPDDRVGALDFGLNQEPPPPRRQHSRLWNLPDLVSAAELVLEMGERDGETLSELDRSRAEQLMLATTSMGGARPKATVLDEGVLWLAKMPRKNDRWNNTRVEQATMALARSCGLHVAETRLVSVAGKDVLMSRRFDRPGFGEEAASLRLMFMSGLSALDVDDDDYSRWSYPALAETIQRLSINHHADRRELFLRMVFNGLVSNGDDHPRNHGFLRDGEGWKLSPAYDITPLPTFAATKVLAMAVGTHGRDVSTTNILSEVPRFGIQVDEAAALVMEMAERVKSTWFGIFRSHGVTEGDCAMMRNAFTVELGDVHRSSWSFAP